MNQFTGDNTRAMSAFCTINSIEKTVGEGVTVGDIAIALDVTRATARKWSQMAVERGLVKFKVRTIMGAAVQYVYFGMFSKTFATLAEFENTNVILSDDQKSVFGMNG